MNKHFISRVIAYFIDMFLISILSSLIINNAKTITLNNLELRISIGYLLIIALYFLFFDVFNYGQTIGKAILNIKVVFFERNSKPSVKDHIKRTFYKIVSIYVIPIAFIIYLFKGIIIQDYYMKTKTVVDLKKAL